MSPRQDGRLELLRATAPGAALREALDRIVQYGRGALIVIAERDVIAPLIVAGFSLDAPFTPQALAELAKMDRAVVTDPGIRTILYANALLAPDPSIPSEETGTRHRVAEQVAKQLSCPVIAVSEERRQVTLYLGSWHHELTDLQTLLNRVTQALTVLDRYRRDLRDALRELAPLELEGRVLPYHVATVIQRFLTLIALEEDIVAMLVELGSHRELPERYLLALMRGVREELFLLVRDFQRDERRPAEETAGELLELKPEEIFQPEAVLRPLGLTEADPETPVPSRGFRLLTKIPRLPISVIERLVEEVGSLDKVARLNYRQLTRVKGIAAARAKAIQYGLSRFKNGYVTDLEGF